MEDETDEENQKQATRQQKEQAIKATVAWEKPKKEPRKGNGSDNEAKSSKSERPKRNRNAPSYYGNRVKICGVEKDRAAPTIIYFSSDEN